MKLTELFDRHELTLSYEVFPPKTQTTFESVKQVTEEVAKLKPPFMSVTYGAGGGTSEYTLAIARNIERYGVPTLAHLTCVTSTKEKVKRRIQKLHAAGIENIMALRGDLLPGMENADRSQWDYRHAVELVRDIRESGIDFCLNLRINQRQTEILRLRTG